MKIDYLAMYIPSWHILTLFLIIGLFELTYVCHLGAKKVLSVNRLTSNTVVLVAPTIKLHEGLEHLMTVYQASIPKPVHTKQSFIILNYKKKNVLLGERPYIKWKNELFKIASFCITYMGQ